MNLEEKRYSIKTRLPYLSKNLTEEQLDFILQPIAEPSSLKACPGSGKTEVVGIKAAYEIANWPDRFSGMAILSFTKNAAKEILSRIKEYSGNYTKQHPHFIGTIDSWIHGYLLHPHGHKLLNYNNASGDKSYRLVDNDDRHKFLTNYQTVLSFKPEYKDAWVNEYYIECSDDLTLHSQKSTLILTGVDQTLKTKLIDNKRAFLKAGFATYSDAEFLCYHLLKKYEQIRTNLIKRFPILMIDECQDLSQNQLAILSLLSSSGAKIHFVGDNNQSIYEFKNVYSEKIDQFITANALKEMRLTKNFRSNQQIVNVALHLEGLNTGTNALPIVGDQVAVLENPCILWLYTPEEFPSLPQKFIDYIHTVNQSIDAQFQKIRIEKSAILSRGKSVISEFKGHRSSDLSTTELFAHALQRWDEKVFSSSDMQVALQHFGKGLSVLAYEGLGNYQNQCCPEPYTHIEWRQTLANLLDEATNSSNQLFPFDNMKWSEWTASFKDYLKKYWPVLKSPTSDLKSASAKIRAPSGAAQSLIENSFRKYTNSFSEDIRMTTIHDAKGETLDATLLISSKDKKSKGGHVEHWISALAEEREYVRFAYVASSRPRHLLIWAIPKKKGAHFKTISEMGFKFL
jgi:DNA helicase-2/ATP-dependent DNA helicase PcrA